jgi:hypothetical protein
MELLYGVSEGWASRRAAGTPFVVVRPFYGSWRQDHLRSADPVHRGCVNLAVQFRMTDNAGRVG